MVHKHRNVQKTALKDVSPMRNMSFNKSALSSSPSGGFHLGSSLTAPVATSACNSAAVDKWKYNNMINNQRDQFNNMHFC